jgi:hypothetical protein
LGSRIGSNWSGKYDLSAGQSFQPALSVDQSTGYSYVAYGDANVGDKLTVQYQQTNAGSWSILGSAGITSGAITSPSIKAQNGVVWVAFQTLSTGELSVMKYSGGAWASVGSTEISSGVAYSPTIALSPSGVPYVAYEDAANGGAATVLTLTLTGWVPVGPAGFTPSTAQGIRLAVDVYGVPHVIYADGHNQNLPAVMKWNGANWMEVGASGFSGDPVSAAEILFAPDGTIFSAINSVSGNSTKVYKYVH